MKKAERTLPWLKVLVGGLLLLALGLYGFACYFLWSKQEALLFPGGNEDIEACSELIALGYKPLRMSTQGQQVRALLLHQGPQAPLLVLFHGNGGTLCGRAIFAANFKRLGYNVFLVEYPGYADESQPSQAAILENALLATDLAKLVMPHSKVVVFGESLGASVGTYVASQRKLDGLILHTLYPSIAAVAQASYPPIPVGLLLRHPFPAHAWAPLVDEPVLALHGDQDALIPYALGQEQAKNFKVCRLVTIPGAGHNDLAQKDEAHYWAEVQTFISALPEAKK